MLLVFFQLTLFLNDLSLGRQHKLQRLIKSIPPSFRKRNKAKLYSNPPYFNNNTSITQGLTSTENSFLLLRQFQSTTPIPPLKQSLISTRNLQSSVQLRRLDSSNLKIEDVTFTILKRNKNNTYTPSRDNRVFATDAGFIEIHITFKCYSSCFYEASFLSLFLGKGITIVKDKLIDKEDYEISSNKTCTNITFLDHFVIKQDYAKVLLAKFAPIYSLGSVPSENPMKYRPFLHNVIIGNRTNSLAFPYTETFMRFHEEGRRRRETILIDIKQPYNSLKPLIITFSFDFVFFPTLESHDNYYFSLLRAKAPDEEDEQWEKVTCAAYGYDEFEHITDCYDDSFKDCLYFYKLELFYDKWNRECTDGYLGTSNVVFFPKNATSNQSEGEDEEVVQRPRVTARANYFPLAVCLIFGVIWFIMMCLIIYCGWRIFSTVKQFYRSQYQFKEGDDKTKEHIDEEDERFESHNKILSEIL